MSRDWKIKVVPADAVIVLRDYHLPPEAPLRPDVEATIRAYNQSVARAWLKRQRAK
jgi:hypothetical protein